MLNGWRLTDAGCNCLLRVRANGSVSLVATFGPDGSLYVLEHSATAPGFAAPGKLTRITPDNVRHVINTGTTLMRPTAIVVDDDGAIYVSNKGAGFAAGGGEVLKIVL